KQVRWGAFKASGGKETLTVYERIYDQNGNGWTDVSAWYWAAILGKTESPWWAITIATHSETPPR
ncbi:MAG: hypothetical protein AB1489_03570, partial [Acidobacteriota bacterium]